MSAKCRVKLLVLTENGSQNLTKLSASRSRIDLLLHFLSLWISVYYQYKGIKKQTTKTGISEIQGVKLSCPLFLITISAMLLDLKFATNNMANPTSKELSWSENNQLGTDIYIQKDACIVYSEILQTVLWPLWRLIKSVYL